ACALGKSKKSSHQPKAEDTNQEKLYLLHEYFTSPSIAVSLVQEANASRAVVLADSPVSTSID
ncbi:hypothetical protein Tco_1321159, partial [Tanacetum coccineum]